MITKVFLLIASYNIGGWNPTLHVETMVFKSADRCIRNQKLNEDELSKKYSDVQVKCFEKEIIGDQK